VSDKLACRPINNVGIHKKVAVSKQLAAFVSKLSFAERLLRFKLVLLFLSKSTYSMRARDKEDIVPGHRGEVNHYVVFSVLVVS